MGSLNNCSIHIKITAKRLENYFWSHGCLNLCTQQLISRSIKIIIWGLLLVLCLVKSLIDLCCSALLSTCWVHGLDSSPQSLRLGAPTGGERGTEPCKCQGDVHAMQLDLCKLSCTCVYMHTGPPLLQVELCPYACTPAHCLRSRVANRPQPNNGPWQGLGTPGLECLAYSFSNFSNC